MRVFVYVVMKIRDIRLSEDEFNLISINIVRQITSLFQIMIFFLVLRHHWLKKILLVLSGGKFEYCQSKF